MFRGNVRKRNPPSQGTVKEDGWGMGNVNSGCPLVGQQSRQPDLSLQSPAAPLCLPPLPPETVKQQRLETAGYLSRPPGGDHYFWVVPTNPLWRGSLVPTNGAH